MKYGWLCKRNPIKVNQGFRHKDYSLTDNPKIPMKSLYKVQCIILQNSWCQLPSLIQNQNIIQVK